MDTMPREIIEEIAFQLTGKNIINLCKTSKRFNAII